MQKIIFLVSTFLMGSLLGCSSVKMISEIPNDNDTGKKNSVAYSSIIYIHGDADYLYHSSNGEALEADKQALERAKDMAEKAKNGEVFIFHKKKHKKILRLFPRRSNRFYHFRNGKLVTQIAYRNRSNSEPFFQTESELFRNVQVKKQPDHLRTFFFYYGHEIPLYPGMPYHSSRPGIAVHTETFSSGVKHFLGDQKKFDVVVLSTCSNGTPKMVSHLHNVADVLLASPQNLHLSHIHPLPVTQIERDQNISSFRLAETIAKDSFQRLTESVQTAVTLSVYDLEKFSQNIEELDRKTDRYINQEAPNMYRDNEDCSTLSFFDPETYRSGVTTFYRPSVFGSGKSGVVHSGWGCKVL